MDLGQPDVLKMDKASEDYCGLCVPKTGSKVGRLLMVTRNLYERLLGHIDAEVSPQAE